MIWLLFLSALVVPALLAQGPFRPPFTCKADDLLWAGMTCSVEEPCPVYLEVANVYPAGAKLFVAGNVHSQDSTLYSILLESEDDGRTWKEPVERIRGAELDAIQFISLDRGWISGQRVFPNAGDPFFLITSDGGRDWRKSSVLPDGSDGFIQRFWFDSARSGSLTLDRGGSDGEQMRYARYETMTGGDSWSVREASDKPVNLGPRSSPSEETPWRVRGDSAQKALVIEKKSTAGWTKVASLALELARCSGEPESAPEPPVKPASEPAHAKDYVEELHLPADTSPKKAKKP